MTAVLGLLACALLGVAPADDPVAEARAALATGSFPWYDATTDGPKSLKPTPEPPDRGEWEFSLFGAGFGQVIMFALMAVLIIGVCVYLAWTWNKNPAGEANLASRRAPGKAIRTAELPPGLTVDTDNPWAEAQRRRAQGDLSGAVVYLFVHLLIALEKKGLVRLAPGRTGRQLVRGIGRDEIRAMAEPTLRLFEAAYYGLRDPSPGEFAVAWEQAEALNRLLATEVAG